MVKIDPLVNFYRANNRIESTSNICQITMKLYSLDSAHFKDSNGMPIISIEGLIVELFKFKKV